MEFLRTAKQRSIVSETIYIVLNLALAAGIFVAIWAFESPVVAFLLVLLSKWRVLAVRPRYWLANIQANLVDLIVSISFVVLIYLAETVLVQAVIALFYAAWLFLLKPQSRRVYMVAQAGVALGIGVTALFNVAYSWPSSAVVLVMWFVGYSVVRHTLSAYDEKQITFLSLVGGLVAAEFGWLAYHWTIAYDLFAVGGLQIPQAAIIVLLVGFFAERMHRSMVEHDGKVQAGDIVLPALLSVSVIAILQIFFNSIGTGAI